MADATTSTNPASPGEHSTSAIPKAPEKPVTEAAEPEPSKDAPTTHPLTTDPRHPFSELGFGATAAPLRPVHRPAAEIATELHEARTLLKAMRDGTPTAPDTPEIVAQHEAVASAETLLATERRKLAEVIATANPPVHPDKIHAQHYVIARLEKELRDSVESGVKP